MPTKPNRAGQQQNYVPAGHGDASGEYGDNATGSNVHIKFTNFQKPTENPTTKKVARTKELTPKQIREIGQDVVKYKGFIQNQLKQDFDTYNWNGFIERLRWYGGNYGDLTNFSDEDLKDIIGEFWQLNKSETPVYYKERGKWFVSKFPEVLDKAGIEYFTAEEKERLEREANVGLVEKSQNEQDKKIQETLGENCVVCFGKGYSKDDLAQIEKDTKTYIDEFPELKDTIKAMGDRNNLEKYLNALRQSTEPSEEDIVKEMARVKKYSLNDYTNEELKKKAVSNLKSKLSISRINNAYAYWSPSEHFMIYMGKMKKITDETKDREFRDNFKSSDKRNATFCHEMGHAVVTALDEFYKKQVDKLEKQMPSYEDYDGTMTQEQIMAKRNEISPKIIELERKRDNFKTELQKLRSQNANKDYTQIFRDTFKKEFDVYPDDMNLDYSTRNLYEKEVERKLFNQGIKKYNLSRYGGTNTDEFVAESFSAYYTGMNNPLANQVVELFKKYAKELRGY